MHHQPRCRRSHRPGWGAGPGHLPAGGGGWSYRAAAGIDARLDELAQLECEDTGKPLALARSLDIPRAAANFRFFATAILHDASESFNVTLELVRRGYGEKDIIAMWGGNVLRVMEDVEKVAKKIQAGR